MLIPFASTRRIKDAVQTRREDSGSTITGETPRNREILIEGVNFGKTDKEKEENSPRLRNTHTHLLILPFRRIFNYILKQRINFHFLKFSLSSSANRLQGSKVNYIQSLTFHALQSSNLSPRVS